MKKDINLLPRSNNKQLSAKSIFLIVLGVLIFGISAYYAISLPVQKIERGKAMELNLQTQLEQYGDFNTRYEQLMIKQEEITFEIAALAQSLDMSKNVYGIIKQLDKSRPNGIDISSIVYSRVEIGRAHV